MFHRSLSNPALHDYLSNPAILLYDLPQSGHTYYLIDYLKHHWWQPSASERKWLKILRKILRELLRKVIFQDRFGRKSTVISIGYSQRCFQQQILLVRFTA